jgi:DNA-binding transcriptional LysR family regulator
MELRQLEYFVAVAEEEHFTRAAERVLVAQPAISQQIRRLEAELGETLFDRDRRHVRLTAAGRTLLPHARATLAAAGRARAAVGSLSGLLTGELTVGVFEGAPERLLADALGQFRRAHPGVEVRVREDYALALLDAVRRGELDAAITALPEARRPGPGPRILELATEPVVLAARPDHPLARCDEIPLARLRGEPMVALVAESTQRAHIERACRKAGFAPRVAAECRHLGLLWDLVEQGVGVAAVPRSAPRGNHHVALVPIVRPRLQVQLVIAAGPDIPAPAAEAFLDIVIQQAAGAGHPLRQERRAVVEGRDVLQ